MLNGLILFSYAGADGPGRRALMSGTRGGGATALGRRRASEVPETASSVASKVGLGRESGSEFGNPTDPRRLPWGGSWRTSEEAPGPNGGSSRSGTRHEG